MPHAVKLRLLIGRGDGWMGLQLLGRLNQGDHGEDSTADEAYHGPKGGNNDVNPDQAKSAEKPYQREDDSNAGPCCCPSQAHADCATDAPQPLFHGNPLITLTKISR